MRGDPAKYKPPTRFLRRGPVVRPRLVIRVGPVLCLTSPYLLGTERHRSHHGVRPPCRATRNQPPRSCRSRRISGPQPFLGASAGHLVLAPAERLKARTTSAARQAVAAESESNAKCGGGAVNFGEGIGCSTGSIGDSEWIRKGRSSQLVRGGVVDRSWNGGLGKKGIKTPVNGSVPDASRGRSRGKIRPRTRKAGRYHCVGIRRKPAWLNGESQVACVIDSRSMPNGPRRGVKCPLFYGRAAPVRARVDIGRVNWHLRASR
jgi:hypothetical protein